MFVYKNWNGFCKKLNEEGFNSICAKTLLEEETQQPFIILKHDVETNPSKALKLAKIENKYSHRGTYYVQAYLLKNEKNIKILKEIEKLGHEVSYHHDVMDSNKGDISKAQVEFQSNLDLFESNGFYIKTVCQHGNPIIERKGYFSNRDFFRNEAMRKKYEKISEIMVNFKSQAKINYKYISDAGYGWKIIFDPEENDIIESSEKDIKLNVIGDAIELLKNNESIIISTHPHRWQSNEVNLKVKNMLFKSIKKISKTLIKIPILKKFMGKFYFLAKKI